MMGVRTRSKDVLTDSLVKVKDEKKKVDETMKAKGDEEKVELENAKREKKKNKNKDQKLNEPRKRKMHLHDDKSTDWVNERYDSKPTRKEEISDKVWFVIVKLVGVVGVMILAFVLLVKAVTSATIFDVKGDELNTKVEFKNKMTTLSESFPTQTQYLWKLIGSASLDVIESENPRRPAVILLAGGPDAHPTLNALASNLSNCYSAMNARNSVTEIDGMQHRNTNPHTTKKFIDETLKTGFSTGSKVAVIHHLESIPAEASMIFHSYCENENAPFKRVVIIFTVHMTEKLNPTDDLKLNQKKVERHLKKQWKDAVDEDHIEAMFSRVATTTAFVNP